MLTDLLEPVIRAIEAAGIAVMVIGIVVGTALYLRDVFGGLAVDTRFRAYRARVGKGILLGLEFLVAADIINTVAIEPTLDSVLVLGGIVLIRTFLSISLEVEIEGHWPWQRAGRESAVKSG